MKSLALLATVCASTALAGRQPLARKEVENALFTIEVAPGETRRINEDERWEIATVSLPLRSRLPPFSLPSLGLEFSS